MIKIEDVIRVLAQQKLPPATLVAVENQLEEIEADKKADKEDSKGPKSKSQFNVILFDANGVVKGDFTALVVQTPEGESPATLLDKVYKASYEFNTTKKGRKHPIKTVADAANIKRAITKAHKIHFKTKEPVQVIVTNNEIPYERK